ncbi:MAG TPA: calcium-binding protein [Tepidisphaeraceae bacterium]|nr:calcium-binding protein [Tepidisphaeraceae bacterium]
MTLFEPLERRQLLSVSVNVATGLLTVTGTNLADLIRVERSGKNLAIHEGRKTTNVALSKVTGIVINGGKGNDSLSVEQNVKVPATLNGEAGNDVLVSGGGADVLSGGDGIDTADYSGRTRALTLVIGGGPVSGESGEHDNILGDVENLIGGRGSDSLVGSAAANVIDAGRGDDSITGNGGNDLLIGGRDDDTYIFTPTTDAQLVKVVEVTLGGDDTLDFSALDASMAVTALLQAKPGANLATCANTQVQNAGQTGDLENVLGGAGDDNITGHNGKNRLVGNGGNDSIYGLGGNDYIDGGEGDDFLDGGTGADDIHGGGGSDTVDHSTRTNGVNVSADDTANDGEAGESDNVHSDVEEIVGGDGNDSLSGAATGSILVGGNGKNILTGGAGADVIFGGPNGDMIVGNGGADVVLCGNGNDTVFTGDSSGDPLATGPDTGGASVFAGGGDDSIVGGNGADFLDGQSGNDTVHGGGGNDSVYGEDGNDYLFGDAGNDFISGGIDNDSIGGGTGQDTVDAGDGADLVQKNLPDPVTGVVATPLRAVVAPTPVVVVVNSDDTDPPIPDPDPPSTPTDPGPGDSVDGGTGNDTLIGGPFDDVLNGGDGADSIQGGDGNDTLNGQDGDNQIFGEGGDDLISTGIGNSTLDGGDGADFFVNAQGLADRVDGGAGYNIAEFDPAGTDTLLNIQLISNPQEVILQVAPGQATPATSPVDGAFGPFTNVANDSITPVVTGQAVLDGGGNLVIDDSLATVKHTVIITQSGTNLVANDNGVITTVPFAAVTGGVIITGGSGDDYFTANNVPVRTEMFGNDGNDTLIGGSYDDGHGTLGDALFGGNGSDLIQGMNGPDNLDGDAGNDSLYGGPGNDTLDGGISGGFYAGGDGRDLLSGGTGNDYANYSTRTDNLVLRLDGTARSGQAGSVENDTIMTDVENLLGGTGNDVLVGNALANYISGGNGNDTIFGAGGGDAILGQGGADKVYGGAAYDFLYISGDGNADGYNIGGATAEFVQKDTSPADFVTADLAPPA